jgi:hypothetical protein
MTERPKWLPKELIYADYGGDWDKFLMDVYKIFECDFKNSLTKYEGLPVYYDSTLEDGKERVFWHLIQRQDCKVEDRVPDLRRCERIPWPKPTIEHPKDKDVSLWKNERKGKKAGHQTRVLLWLENLDYLVILRERSTKMILITAYCTDIPSHRAKLIKERDAYLKMQKPPDRAT